MTPRRAVWRDLALKARKGSCRVPFKTRDNGNRPQRGQLIRVILFYTQRRSSLTKSINDQLVLEKIFSPGYFLQEFFGGKHSEHGRFLDRYFSRGKQSRSRHLFVEQPSLILGQQISQRKRRGLITRRVHLSRLCLPTELSAPSINRWSITIFNSPPRPS